MIEHVGQQQIIHAGGGRARKQFRDHPAPAGARSPPCVNALIERLHSQPITRSVTRIASYEKSAATSSIISMAFCCAFSCEIFLLRLRLQPLSLALDCSSLLNRSGVPADAGRRLPAAGGQNECARHVPVSARSTDRYRVRWPSDAAKPWARSGQSCRDRATGWQRTSVYR